MKMSQLARCKHYCKHSLQNIDKFLFVTLANEENVETIQRVSSVMIISPNNLTAVTREIAQIAHNKTRRHISRS